MNDAYNKSIRIFRNSETGKTDTRWWMYCGNCKKEHWLMWNTPKECIAVEYRAPSSKDIEDTLVVLNKE